MKILVVIWLASMVSFVCGWWAGSRVAKNRVLLWLADPPSTETEADPPRPEEPGRTRPQRARSHRTDDLFDRPPVAVPADETAVDAGRPARPRA